MLITRGCGPLLPAVIRGHPALASSKSLYGETRQLRGSEIWLGKKTNHTYRFQADCPSWIVKEVALISRDGVLKDAGRRKASLTAFRG